MERVAFLIEATGERLACLLNPESVTIRRQAGVRPRHSARGSVTGAALRDDPLLFTGGGLTELKLDLLFDVSVAGSSVRSDDIRDLTQPLRELAENGRATGQVPFGRPPLATFVWGKAWNIRGVVTTIAERLEQFTAQGQPRRSWLRMRFVRVDEPPRRRPRSRVAPPPPPDSSLLDAAWSGSVSSEPAAAEPLREREALEVIGGGGEDSRPVERLDQIAERQLGDASWWRWIAAANDVENPLQLEPGRLLRIPSFDELRRPQPTN